MTFKRVGKGDNLVGLAIGKFARDLRQKRGISSQIKMSVISGVSRNTIVNVESNLPPNTVSLDLILSSLGVTWEELGREIDKYKRREGARKP